VPELGDEYVCRVENVEGRDAMTVVCEADGTNEDLRDRVATLLRQRLGVGVAVEIVGLGGTAEATQVEKRQKPIRLVDAR
jgi:phenylacetate-CoA ligase